MAFALCTREEGKSLLLSLPGLIRPPILLDKDPTLITSFNLINSLKPLSPNTVILGVGLQPMNILGGGRRDTIQSITGGENPRKRVKEKKELRQRKR